MRDYGYLRIMACSPRVRVADVRFNCQTITEAIEAADAARAALVVFPELSLTGYTCGDLFGQNLLIDKAEEAAKEIVRVSRKGRDHRDGRSGPVRRAPLQLRRRDPQRPAQGPGPENLPAYVQ